MLRSAGCDDATIDTVLLCAAELVTNAIVHVGADIDVVVDASGSRVRVEVHDRSPRPPLRRVLAPDASAGRGLHLVDALADRWGVEATDGGKIVWFEVTGRSDEGLVPAV